MTYAWSTSDSADGEYTTIEGQTGASLAVTADMIGKFIKLNVTGAGESKAEAVTAEAVAIKVEEMTATQTGAKTIEVLLPEAPAGDEIYTVTRNNTEQTIASTAIDGNKVTLTLDTSIKAVEYTVSSSNEALSDATFTGEEAKLTEINIGEYLIANGQDASNNYIYKAAYETLDQWGGEYTVSSFDSAVCSAGTVTYSKGVMTVNAGANALIVGAQHTASLVSGSVVGTSTLTVSAASVVSEITIGDLTMTEAEAKINTTGRIDSDDLFSGTAYYFPIIAVDQYGSALTTAELNSMVNAAAPTLIVSPDNSGATVGFGTANAGNTTFDDIDGAPVLFVKGNGSAYGDVSISFVSTAGVTAQATATIAQDEQIASVTLTPDGSFKSGSATEIAIEAKNNYDEDVDLVEQVTPSVESDSNLIFSYKGGDSHAVAETGTRISLSSEAVWSFSKSSGQYVFSITPASTTTIVATIYTNGGVSVSTQTYTPSAEAYAATFKGFTSDVTLTVAFAGVASGKDITGAATDINVEYYDQYGDVYTGSTPKTELPAFQDATDKNAVTLGDATIPEYYYTITASGATKLTEAISKGIDYKKNEQTDGGTDTYVLTLYKLTKDVAADGGKTFTERASAYKIDEYTFKVTVAASEYEGFTAELADSDGLLYTGTAVDYETIVLKGKDASDNEIVLDIDDDAYTAKLRKNSVAGATLACVKGKVTVGTPYTTSDKTGTAYVDVYDKAGTIVASVEIPCSNEAPIVSEIKAVDSKGGDVDLTAGLTVGGDAQGLVDNTDAKCIVLYINESGEAADNDYTYKITSVDQYGQSLFDTMMFAGQDISGYNTSTPFGTGSLVLAAGDQSVTCKVTNEGYAEAMTAINNITSDALNAAAKGATYTAGNDTFNIWFDNIKNAVEESGDAQSDKTLTYKWSEETFAIDSNTKEGKDYTSNSSGETNKVSAKVTVSLNGYSKVFTISVEDTQI